MDCETNLVSEQLFEMSIADLDTLYPGTLDPGTVDFRAGATPSASRDGAYGAAFGGCQRFALGGAFGTTQAVLGAARMPTLRASS